MSMDPKLIIEQFQDWLAPRLDTYEQAIYLYLFRHGRLQGIEEIVVGFKSARRRMALGVGAQGTPMAEGTCYEKLRSLQTKGCIDILASERGGTRIRLRLPSEISGLIQAPMLEPTVSLDDLDFFEVPANRRAILVREAGRCFYCLRTIDQASHVIEHVVSRPDGGNGYRNVVAACRECNNRKGSIVAEEFLRALYRSGVLGASDLQARLAALEELRAGRLKPSLDDGLTGSESFAV